MTYEALRRDLRHAYDRAADVRDGMADADWKQPERERFGGLLRRAGAAKVLEVGAGHGVSGRYLADQGFAVTCVDLSPELAARCRAKALTACVMDFGALGFAPACFDAAFGMNCLLHVPRAALDGVLGSIGRALTPGGLFYWGQYGGHDFEGIYADDSYEPKRFFSRMTDDQIQLAATQHFEIVDFRGIPLDIDGWTYQALVLRRPAHP
jgi:SAM-dependent methyltransferase